MKIIKHWLVVLAAMALLVASCGSDTEEPAAGEDPTTTTEAAMEDDESTTTEDAMEDDPPASAGENCASEEEICIGLVTDTGKVDDKSFNQSAWEGAQAAASDLGAFVDFIETVETKDYEANIQTFVDKGFDMIVTVGFGMGEATGIAAAANPGIAFIGVDQFQGEPADNVAGLIFNEDKAGFMAGALAGLLTESNVVGAVLGTDIVPPVVAFKEGYEAGAQYTNPDVNLISTYHPGGLDVAFGDPAWGANTARQAIDQGADVIFGAGGATGNGALAEVAKEGGAAFCIGVDSDQWETVPEAQPCLVTSAMKLIDIGVADLIKLGAKGELPSGNYVGDVGIAPYHDFDSVVSAEVKAEMETIIAGILDGSIETGYGG